MGLPLDLQKCRLRITTAIKLDVVMCVFVCVCVCVCLKDLCWDKSLLSFIVFATYLFWSGCTHSGPTEPSASPPPFPQAKNIAEHGQPFPHLPNPRPALPLPPLPVYCSPSHSLSFPPVSSVCCRGKWHGGCLAWNNTLWCGQGDTVRVCCTNVGV